MALPSTVSFSVGQTDYIAKLNQLITDINDVWTAFQATQTGALFNATSTTSNAIAETAAANAARLIGRGQGRTRERGKAPRILCMNGGGCGVPGGPGLSAR